MFLGNLNSQRDWGHAKDYVEMQWRMLQAPVAKDYVIATGESYTVRQFAIWAGEAIGLKIEFNGENENEVG